MAVNVQRTDLYVGLFLVATVALVAIALIATSGWGVDRYDVFVRTENATDVATDSKVFMQGLEVGRVVSIAPRPVGEAGRLEFVVRVQLLDRFPDGTPLRLPRGATAEVVSGLLGGATIQLTVNPGSGGSLAPGDTIEMRRGTSPIEAFGALANDLKGTIQQTLVSATGTMNAIRGLADSLKVTTGTARRFLVATQPGTEKLLDGVSANLDRLRLVLDSANVRTALTFTQVNSTMTQTRTLLASVDTLTRLLIAMGGENRPEVSAMIVNFRNISTELAYVLEQISRRPMRLISGVKIPDSLSVEGRRAAAAESARRASLAPDSARRPNP
jgi:ABC-type transporter Mla subunit MlaD